MSGYYGYVSGGTYVLYTTQRGYEGIRGYMGTVVLGGTGGMRVRDGMRMATNMERDMERMLDAFERDVERFTGGEMLQNVCEIKARVVAEAMAERRAVRGERWLAVLGLVAAKGVRSVLSRLHEDEKQHEKRLSDCEFVLEDAVMTAYHVLRSSSATDGDAARCSSLPNSGLQPTRVDATLLRGAFSRVLAFFVGISSTDHPTVCVWADVALLLSLCRLRRDPQTHHETRELLDAVVTTTQRGAAAAWPLFLLGMIHAVVLHDTVQALACVKESVAFLHGRESSGPVHYWYAVLLSQNDSSRASHGAAIEQLRVAIRCDYHAVASLNLQALLALQKEDLYAASEALERSIDIDFDQAVSMFNYALLLKRMGNDQAQYQMLAFYREATVAAGDIDTQDLSKQAALELFSNSDESRLFECQGTTVRPGVVALEMARSAVACGAWQEAREHYEEYFSTPKLHTSDAAHVHAVRSMIYVLLQCNRPTEALQHCDIASRNASTRDLFVEFYRADALLCQERVEECEAHLRTVIEPLLRDQIEKAPSAEQREVHKLHLQLLNNLAVAVVCRGDVERAVTILRDCSKQYAVDMRVTFNLVLLLWRLERRDAACALWFEARGWNLRMDVSDMREQQKILDFVARLEDEALSSASPRRLITSHVADDAEESGQVDEQQLRYLDVLILNYWSKANSSQVAKTAARYVEYLESVSAQVSKLK